MKRAKARLTEAQQVRSLHVELFEQIEGPQGDAWISDEAGTDSMKEFFRFVEGHLAANIEATQVIRAFLRKHSKVRRAPAGSYACVHAPAGKLEGATLSWMPLMRGQIPPHARVGMVLPIPELNPERPQ